jgi:signal transduction histidine kinase
MQARSDEASPGGQHAERDRVLVVDSDASSQTGELTRLLTGQGCVVSVAGIQAAKADTYFLAVVARGQSDECGRECLRRLHEQAPTLRVAIVGRAGDVAGAVDVMRARAFDYLEDPVTAVAIERLIRRARKEPNPLQVALVDSLKSLTPGLVHELRNPLSGVLAGSQMLARLLHDGDTTSGYAGIIQEEAQKLARFLARLAEFGRLRSGGMQWAESVDLPDLLGRVVAAAAPAYEARHIQIVSSFDPRTSTLRADPARLTQACVELLDNARETMPDGGTLTISTRWMADVGKQGPPAPEVASAAQDGWICVEFRDTGPGFTAEARQRACEPFFSTRPGSLGIGLSLVLAIVCGHGGTMRLGADGEPGGSVELFLPVTAARQTGGRSLHGLREPGVARKDLPKD